MENITLENLYSEEFMNKNMDKLNWKEISSIPNLSEKFIEKYFDKLDLDEICFNPNISLKFIDKHSDKLNFELLELATVGGAGFRNPFSLQFIAKHADKFNLEDVFSHHNYSTKSLEKVYKKIGIERLKKVIRFLPKEFVKNHIEELK